MRICVIHLNQIGDLMFSLPLLKALRDRYPDSLIHSVLKSSLGELLAESPLVDEIIPKPEKFSQKVSLARKLRKQRYDLLICLPRSEGALILTAVSGAGTKAGFEHFPWDLALDVRESVDRHNCWPSNARLLERLGVPRTAGDYVGLLSIDPLERDIALDGPYVVISAGASPRRLAKAWDEDKFARLIVRLHERYALTPVLVGAGDTKESNALIARGVESDARGGAVPVVDLTGRLGLRELAALLKKASLFVGIDSGVMHLASALDTPVVALFGPTDPALVGPQNRRSEVVRHVMSCVPCYLDRTCEEVECMRSLAVDEVMDACTRILEW